MSDNTTNDTSDDDTEGHRFVPIDERAPVIDTPLAEAADEDLSEDTEGHRRKFRG